ncbi:MAG: dihydrofolate reductase [Tannerellaceae bacterium]|nr:dihydrofolate reductase [Tannerellaceae bacterium]
MKIVLIATVTANGQLLLAENMVQVNTPPEVMGVFIQKAIEAGNLVIGHRTYQMIMQTPAIKEAFTGLDIVVLSEKEGENSDYTVVSSPEQAVNYLKTQGHRTIILAGGLQTYNSFLDKELVTDMYLSIVPVIIGNGGILKTTGNTILNFKLAKYQILVENIIRLHYSKE